MSHTCRGTVNLIGAFIDSVDTTHFVISNGHSQVYHLRAASAVEKQNWVTMLELSKAKAIKSMESGEAAYEHMLYFTVLCMHQVSSTIPHFPLSVELLL